MPVPASNRIWTRHPVNLGNHAQICVLLPIAAQTLVYFHKLQTVPVSH
jgi:hypothetical protein